KDLVRLDVARRLGADCVINVGEEEPRERIRVVTGGAGVDVAPDCAAGGGVAPVLLGIDALRSKGGTMLVKGEVAKFPDFQIGKVATKYITIKSARGHNFESCELALKQLNSKRFPLELITTHRMGLKDTDQAIKAVGAAKDVIHVSLMPWQ